MTLADQYAADILVHDFIETVTYTSPAVDEEPQTGVKAVRGDQARDAVIASGVVGVKPTDVGWTIAAVSLTGQPARSGTITDSGGVVWQILGYTTRSAGATPVSYLCACRKEV